VVSVEAGSPGSPGEVKGIVNDEVFGNININSNFGLFGKLNDKDKIRNK